MGTCTKGHKVLGSNVNGQEVDSGEECQHLAPNAFVS